MNMSVGVFIVTHCQGEVGDGNSAPQNTDLPSHDYEGLSPNVGDELTGSDGTWIGADSYARQWKRSGVAISGATNATYTTVDADFGHTLTYAVTATGAGGVTEAVSAASGAVDFAWALNDQYTTADATPITSPRTAEPGPGTGTVTDTGSKAAISGGELVLTGASAVNWEDPCIVYGAVTRAAGVTLIAKVNRASGAFEYIAGFRDATTGSGATNTPHGLYANTSGWRYIDKTSSHIIGGVPALTTDYYLALVLRSSGAFVFIKGGIYTNWTLLFVDNQTSTATLYPAIQIGASASVFNTSNIRVRTLPTPFNTDDGIAVVNVASPASAANQTATADAAINFVFALPGSPSAGDEVGVKYRVQDASNYWHAKIVRNAGNTAWDFQVRTVSGGVASAPSGWTDVTGVGTPVQLQITCLGSTHAFFTRASATWTKRGATLSVSHLNTQTAINATYAAGTTATSLKAYAATSATYDELERGIHDPI